MPFPTIRTMKRDAVIIVEFEKPKLHNAIFKISLSESVSSQPFSWMRETLWHLDFVVYTFPSMWIRHNHNHKIMLVTNSNFLWIELVLLNFLPSRVPPLLPSYWTAHPFISMYFPLNKVPCPYTTHWELVELTCIINSIGMTQKQN